MLEQASTITQEGFRKVTHVIFDLDGLLIDTETVYKDVITTIAKIHGKTYTNEIRAKVLGIPDIDGAKVAIKEMNLPLSTEEFLNELRNRSTQIFETSPCILLPGAERLVTHLSKSAIPIAVATSSTQESFNLKTNKRNDIFSLFHHVVVGSDPEVKQGKPQPDIFLVCASRFPNNPNPTQCLVLEDSPNGVTAAISAGMQCIMVPDPYVHPESTKHATQVLKSLDDVHPELYGLPPFKIG